VIDPGGYTTDLPADLRGVVGIVITHEHPDHLDPVHIDRLLNANPDAQIYALPSVEHTLPSTDKHHAVGPNSSIKAGPFALEFYGGRHAQIAPGMGTIDCLGVMVNGQLAYAGDSFAAPPSPPQLLAVPTSGPWLKCADLIEYVTTIKPPMAFPTHEAFASARGQALANGLIGAAAKAAGIDWRVLQCGEGLDLTESPAEAEVPAH
jgi:hypothetical protein